MKLTMKKRYEGLQWFYESDNGETLSIICHDHSYGGPDGRFEAQCSWLDDVQGYLSFGQVQRKIDTIRRREIKSAQAEIRK